MKNFCFNPFTGLDISTSGDLKPCCKFLNDQIPKFNIKQGIGKYKNSKWLKKLQSDFKKDKRPEGCAKCWREEDAGLMSKRQMDSSRFEDQFKKMDLDRVGFTNVAVAFGNICNLACRICGPKDSSRWVAEIKKHDKKDNPIHQWFKDPKILQDLYQSTKNAVHFDVPGGEPILLEIEEHFDFLKKFGDRSGEISLHYVTNATTFPKKSFINIWKKFKTVDIQMSIDGTEKRYEYNRWPAKWNRVYNNMLKYRKLSRENNNIKLSISHTVSAFTILYVDDFVKWCIVNGFPKPWLGPLYKPAHYRPGIFPKLIKDRIIEKLESSRYNDVKSLIPYVEQDDEKYYPLFQTMTKKLDKDRKQNFAKTFEGLV